MRILSLGTREDGRVELERVGVDPIAIPILLAKQRTYAVSIDDLPCSTVNILKQTALALGADCAMHRDVIRGRRRRSRVVVFANRRQLGRICERLLEQPPTARAVSENLRRLVRVYESPRRVLKVRDVALDLSERTYLMGILNVTPDSFSDGGRFLAPEDALAQGLELASAGADFIDLGAESTRPGAQPVDAKQELARLLPVLIPLRKRTSAFISIDTYKSETARACLAEGADMINDISGLRFDRELAGVIARARAACVVMHIKGRPRTMQRHPKYRDLMGEIFEYLTDCIGRAALAGIAMEQVIVDPGIGFGKSVEDNFTILRRLAEFRSLGQPLLVGPSRKSFIGAALNLPAQERLSGTVAASVLAVANGANILRVHDVPAVKQAVMVAERILRCRQSVTKSLRVPSAR
jgi:dihydropteroate synthase